MSMDVNKLRRTIEIQSMTYEVLRAECVALRAKNKLLEAELEMHRASHEAPKEYTHTPRDFFLRT